MRKAIILIPFITLTLAACGQASSYTKEKAEVIDVKKDRFTYNITVSYPISGGKYAIDEIRLRNLDEASRYHLHDTVIVFLNSNNNVKEITTNESSK